MRLTSIFGPFGRPFPFALSLKFILRLLEFRYPRVHEVKRERTELIFGRLWCHSYAPVSVLIQSFS